MSAMEILWTVSHIVGSAVCHVGDNLQVCIHRQAGGGAAEAVRGAAGAQVVPVPA